VVKPDPPGDDVPKAGGMIEGVIVFRDPENQAKLLEVFRLTSADPGVDPCLKDPIIDVLGRPILNGDHIVKRLDQCGFWGVWDSVKSDLGTRPTEIP
jgi:hypothetical protein